jgi:IS5 family transposase
MGRDYLKGPDCDRINAVLAAAGYNFRLLLRWLAKLLRALVMALTSSPPRSERPNIPSGQFFTVDS